MAQNLKREETLKNKKMINFLLSLLLIALTFIFLAPIFIVLINSFKGQFFISSEPFKFPTTQTFVGITNYINGINKIDFVNALFYSLFITIFSVVALIFFTSMTSWYIVRVKSKFTSFLYYTFVFSMIVPFQMVMFTMSKVANVLKLDTPIGLVLLYLGFGSGLCIFIYSGFVKSIPKEIEEAATIDGCNALQTYFRVVFPILKPTSITIAILNAMWVWNDFLLPYLVIGTNYRTLPVAIQYLQGGYGSKDMGALMAVLILSIVPIIIFYISCQKYIIRGVVAGAVKG